MCCRSSYSHDYSVCFIKHTTYMNSKCLKTWKKRAANQCLCVHPLHCCVQKTYVRRHRPCQFWPLHRTPGTSTASCVLQKSDSLMHFPKTSVTKMPTANQCYPESLRSCLAVGSPQDIGLKHLTSVGSEAAIKFGGLFPSSVHQLRQTS